MQLQVPEHAFLRQVCNLNDGTARVRFLVGHHLQPFARRSQDASLDGDTTFEVSQRLVQNSRSLDLPVDAIDVSTSIPKDLQHLVAEAHGLDARLPRRVHRLVEAASRELRLDDGLEGCLCILDIEVEQPQVEVARLRGGLEDRSSGRMEGIVEQSELKRIPLRFARIVEAGVFLAKRTAGITIVTEASEELVQHPVMAF
jgi:hypothetical protein